MFLAIALGPGKWTAVLSSICFAAEEGAGASFAGAEGWMSQRALPSLGWRAWRKPVGESWGRVPDWNSPP